MSAKISGNTSGQCSGRRLGRSGGTACLDGAVGPVGQFVGAGVHGDADAVSEAYELGVAGLALELRGGEAFGGDGVGDHVQRAGQCAGLGKEPGLVLDVADGDDRRGGDPATQVGRILQAVAASLRRSRGFRR